ncbi:MAG: hypothetical protein PVJ63_07870 [Thioalkalispiraceae bacterium]|jgi:hypothetical protein
MKKLIILLTGFFLSTGIALADPSASDCGDDDVKPITLSASQSE